MKGVMNLAAVPAKRKTKRNPMIGKPRIDVKSRIFRHWQLYFVILIPVAYVFIFNYIPMYGVTIAFKDFYSTRGILGSPWIGFRHFERFLNSPSFWRIMWNTLAISIYSLVAGIPFPIILALAINETKKSSIRKSVQMITYAPYFISTVIMVGMLFQMLDFRSGLFNALLGFVGRDPINYMSRIELFRSIYVWSGIWQFTGFGSIIYIAALSSIDPTLYEAAVIDGANRRQRILHIDIPGILPIFTILLILNVGQIMNVGFEKIFLMQNALNVRVSEVIATYVYKVGLRSADFSFGAAVGLFNSIINMILIISVNAICKKLGETSLW